MSNVKKPRARKEQREEAQQFIDTLQGVSFPKSRRIYLQGSRSDLQVPMREIQLSPTLIGGDKDNPQYEQNEAIPVYDTAGPYGDRSLNSTYILAWRSYAPVGSPNAVIPKPSKT